MKILRRRRVIKKSENCRIKYGDCRSFDILEITIKDGDDTYIYQVEAKHLSTEVDSVHFYPQRENGMLKVKWVEWVAPYMNLVYSSQTDFDVFWKLKNLIKRMICSFKRIFV